MNRPDDPRTDQPAATDHRAPPTEPDDPDDPRTDQPAATDHRVPPIELDDPDDPRLDRFRDLIARGDRPDPDVFFAESETAVARLLASPRFTTLALLGTPAHLARLPAPPACEVLAGSRALLRAVLGFDLHRGVIACAARPRPLAWGRELAPGTCPIEPVLGDSWLADLLARPRWTVLVVQGLADPANLGSIVRSARAFAVDLVVLDRRGADPLGRRAIRGAMGHVFAQPLAVAADLEAATQRLRQAGAGVWAATVGPRARPLGAMARPPRLALLVGNEGLGLPAPLCAAADLEVTIPICPAVDSLGVAAATAVLLHAVTAVTAKPGPTPDADVLS